MIPGLSFFTPTNSRRSVLLAAYHSPHGLTWSWSLSVTFDGIWRHKGWPRFGLHPYKTNGGWQVVLTLPGIVFHRAQQREMWWRDIARNEMGRADEERHNATLERLRASEAAQLAAMRPEGGVQ